MRSLLEMIESVRLDDGMGADLKTIFAASVSLGAHLSVAVGNAFGSGSVLTWLGCAAAIYLFILDRVNWTTNLLTALLVPYMFLNLPGILLRYIRSDFGLWVAFIAVVLRLFFPQYLPHHAELPACLILLLVTAPMTLVDIRFTLLGRIISLAIGLYLLYEHIQSAGGFRKAFVEHGVPVTIGIIVLFLAPALQFI